MFRDGDIGPWIARHNMTSAGYQQEVNTWWPQGYFPLYVQGGGQGAGTRFACLFVKRDRPVERTFTMTGTPVAAFQAVDTKVEQVMRQSGTRACAVAITRAGRLVHARGYTWAEPSYPVTQPTTMFRIASCSKPITAMAIHLLIQEGRLRLTDKMQTLLNLQPPPGRSIAANMDRITVHHLLTHTAGWDRSQVSDLPPVQDVARAFHQCFLPVTREQMARYQLSRPLQFTPGTKFAYNNLGYLLLGLIVDKVAGSHYVSFVRRRIMAPLGLTRPHRARTTDRGDQSPVLRQAARDPMWTVQPFVPGVNYANGWDRFDAGGGRFRVQHGGGMPGVSSHILWRSDNLGIAVFGNGPALPDIYPEVDAIPAASWPDHDLFPQVGIPSF